MALKQNDSEFFRPLWRRVAVIAAVAAWFGFEVLYSHDQTWMMLTGIALAYSIWNFIIRWPQDNPVPVPPAALPPSDAQIEQPPDPPVPPKA